MRTVADRTREALIDVRTMLFKRTVTQDDVEVVTLRTQVIGVARTGRDHRVRRKIGD